SELKGPRIFVKRDDLTGLGFGGNKVRKLEFLMPAILEAKSDCIVTGAFIQSNWCTAVSAAARKCGLEVFLVKKGPDGYQPEEYDGNHLLHHLLGAEMQITRPENEDAATAATVDRLRRAGRRPYVIEGAGKSPHSVAGYIDAMRELARQSADLGLKVDYLVHTSGGGGTQAGTVIGTKMHAKGTQVICSTSGSRKKEAGAELVMSHIRETL